MFCELCEMRPSFSNSIFQSQPPQRFTFSNCRSQTRDPNSFNPPAPTHVEQKFSSDISYTVQQTRWKIDESEFGEF